MSFIKKQGCQIILHGKRKTILKDQDIQSNGDEHDKEAIDFKYNGLNQEIYNFILNILSDNGIDNCIEDEQQYEMGATSLKNKAAIPFHLPLFFSLKNLIVQFLLNKLEITILAYIIKKTEWNFQSCSKYLEENHSLTPFLYISDSYETDKYDNTALQIYLSFCAYAVKLFCNELAEPNLFSAYLYRKNSALLIHFEDWFKIQNIDNLLKYITLTEINNLNQEYQEIRSKPNYNVMVEIVLNMSSLKKRKEIDEKQEGIHEVKNEKKVKISQKAIQKGKKYKKPKAILEIDNFIYQN